MEEGQFYSPLLAKFVDDFTHFKSIKDLYYIIMIHTEN